MAIKQIFTENNSDNIEEDLDFLLSLNEPICSEMPVNVVTQTKMINSTGILLYICIFLRFFKMYCVPNINIKFFCFVLYRAKDDELLSKRIKID